MKKRLFLGVTLLALLSATFFVAFAAGRDTENSQLIGAVLTATAPAEMDHSGHGGDETEAEAADDLEFTSLADLPNGRASDGAFYVGLDDAPVTIVEFADWACPHCQAYRETINLMIEEYVVTGMARFEFRMFPTAGGQDTYIAGKLAECVADSVENGFWLAYDLLYELGAAGRFEAQIILRVFSREFDIDEADLIECAEKAEQVDVDMALAVEVGVSGTPGVLVRYLDEEGDYSDMEFIALEGILFNRGGPPFGVLEYVIENAEKRVNRAEV